jgi:hypothetical protein
VQEVQEVQEKNIFGEWSKKAIPQKNTNKFGFSLGLH